MACYGALQEGATYKALLEGKKRARIVRYTSQDEFFRVEVEEIEECPNGGWLDWGLVGP